jgi:hypothetical protein
MSQIVSRTLRVNPADAFSLRGDKALFDRIVADQERNAGPLRPAQNWDLSIGGHDGSQYFQTQQMGEAVQLDTYSDQHYYRNFASLQQMMEPFVGSTGLQNINREVIQQYYDYLKGIDHLEIVPHYFNDNGSMKPRADGLLITDLGSIIDVNLISAFLDPDANAYKILEVGGGYGRLAEVFLNIYGKSRIKYVLLDAVPASLMYSYLYLSRHFPDRRIGFYYNDDPFDLDECDCYIMPAWHFDASPQAASFDCCINVQSMQEMSQHHIDHYLSLFDQLLRQGSGIAYLSNERDYIFRGLWNYPRHWRLLWKARTPRSWTRNSPTEVFLKSVGSFQRENQLVDFIYSLQLEELDRNREQSETIASLHTEILKSQQEIQQRQQEIAILRAELQRGYEEVSGLRLELQNHRQKIYDLQRDLEAIRQHAVRLSSTLARLPLASETPTAEETEVSMIRLYDYYRSPELPEVARLFEPVSKVGARLLAVNLYLRQGRYGKALSHLLRVGKLDPLMLISLQTLRVIANGLVARGRRA